MGRIEFDNLNNTRDLGGIIAADGRMIRPGMLIRSGRLGQASFGDLVKLQELCSLVVDFRTPSEVLELPDPDIAGTENIHLPVVEDLTAGVSREEESDVYTGNC